MFSGVGLILYHNRVQFGFLALCLLIRVLVYMFNVLAQHYSF